MADLNELDPHAGNPHTRIEHDAGHDRKRPWHRQVHRSWIFWVAILLMLAAIFVYIRSFDLSLRPRSAEPRQVVP